MIPTVRDKADTVATWRFIAVFLMETLARWVPSVPELEAKALFGRHIWDLAQLADQLGHRTAELRASLHESRPPRSDYAEALAQLAGRERTGDRLAGFHDAALADMQHRFDAFLAQADPLLDEPTVRIVERTQAALRRMFDLRVVLLGERPDLRAHDVAALERLRAAFAAADPVERRAPATGAS